MNRPAQSVKNCSIIHSLHKRGRGDEAGAVRPPGESSGRPFGLPEEGKAKGDHRRAHKQRKNGVGGDDVPDDSNAGRNGLTSLGKQTGGSDNGILRSFLLYADGLKALVAGAGFEPAAPDAESGMLPLHHPAIYLESLFDASSTLYKDFTTV